MLLYHFPTRIVFRYHAFVPAWSAVYTFFNPFYLVTHCDSIYFHFLFQYGSDNMHSNNSDKDGGCLLNQYSSYNIFRLLDEYIRCPSCCTYVHIY